MNLLILLNGKSDIIIEKHGLDRNNLEIIKLDEKDLAKPREMIKIMRRKPYDNIYFGCIANSLQRFQFFIKFYFFITRKNHGLIIDHNRNCVKMNVSKFIFVEVIKFAFEVFVSVVVIMYNFIKLPYLKWIYLKKS